VLRPLLVLTLLSGCFSYQTSKGVAKAGGGVILVGAVLEGYALQSDKSFHDSAPVVIPVIAVGAALAAFGIVGMIVHDKPQY